MAQASSAVGPITLISLHASPQGSSVAHIEELLDRLSAALAASFILAGDFNSCRLAEQVWPGYRHLEFFDCAETRYGMVNCFWREHSREQRTYWPGCRDAGKPFQADHIFVSTDLQERVRSCTVLDYEAFRGISDHTPIILVIDL
jgi:endonuclease/exonuclease/phosphatase family metal-dependent hydrolase